MTSTLNFDLVASWVYSRKDARKDDISRCFFDFAKVCDLLSEKYEVNISYIELQEMRRYVHQYQHTLFWTGGSPNLHLCKITPAADYLFVKQNPRFNLWKDWPIDYTIIDRFKAFKNNKFNQPDLHIELPEKYDLFLLQNMGIGARDFPYTKDALEYATNTKTYTLFKGHPALKDQKGNHTAYHKQPNREIWEEYTQSGWVSEYTIFIDDANTDELMEHAQITYAGNSVASLAAMLKGYKTATYADNDLSEILPQIKTAYELKDVQSVDIETLTRFLSWYYHSLCIDCSTKEYDWEKKLERIVSGFKIGERTKELFGWKS
jgi:hypothetical protein